MITIRTQHKNPALRACDGYAKASPDDLSVRFDDREMAHLYDRRPVDTGLAFVTLAIALPVVMQ